MAEGILWYCNNSMLARAKSPQEVAMSAGGGRTSSLRRKPGRNHASRPPRRYLTWYPSTTGRRRITYTYYTHGRSGRHLVSCGQRTCSSCPSSTNCFQTVLAGTYLIFEHFRGPKVNVILISQALICYSILHCLFYLIIIKRGWALFHFGSR